MALPTPLDILAEAERSVARYGRVVLCHVVRAEGSTPGKLGWRLLVQPDGSVVGNLGGGAFEAMVKVDAEAKLLGSDAPSEVKRYYLTEEATKGEATGMVCGGMMEVLLEVLTGVPTMVICGGGPVGQALAEAGRLAGFGLVVADDRPEFRDPALFPPGTRFAAVDRDYSQDFLDPVREGELLVAVVTRCWETDIAALAAVLRHDLPRLTYLGLMGSRRKIARVKEEVEQRGFRLEDVELHAPIGLPVGGDTPGEIAIGVVAEMLGARQAQRGAAPGGAGEPAVSASAPGARQGSA